MFRKFGAAEGETLDQLADRLTEEAETKQNFAVIHVVKAGDKYEALFEHIAAVR